MEAYIQELMQWENLVALLTLTGLEIVLGIDNIVFITIVVEKLPEEKRPLGRRVGLILAMLMRIGLLFLVSWIVKLNTPLFEIFGHGITGHALILILGGLFLVAKATWEIREKLEEISAHIDEKDLLHGKGIERPRRAGFWFVISQIIMLDLIFSIDSVITAVGMAKSIVVIIVAVITAVVVMLVFAELIAGFVAKNPTIKMLALAFLILIGVSLVAEGFEAHMPKGYIYTAMGFSLAVELINLKVIKAMLRKRGRLKGQSAKPGEAIFEEPPDAG